jgi:hypothetical protein
MPSTPTPYWIISFSRSAERSSCSSMHQKQAWVCMASQPGSAHLLIVLLQIG